jgi:hypothetical protein
MTTAGITNLGSTLDLTGNLSTGGEATVAGATTVGGNIDTSTTSTFNSTVDVTGNITAGGDTTIAGATDVGGSITNNSGGFTTIDGAVAVGGNVTTAGETTLNSTVDVTGNLTTSGVTTVTGATTVGGNINITTTSTFDSTVDVTGNMTTGGTTTIAGTTDVGGSFNNSAGGVTFGDTVDVGTTLTTGGTTSFGGTVAAGNNITTGGDTTLNGDVDGASFVFGGSTLTVAADSILRSTTNSIDFPASVIGSGALGIDPTDGTALTISNSGGGTAGVIEANVFSNFLGHLVIGGTTTPLSSTPLDADSFDVSAASIDVQVPLVSGGPITLLAGDINLAAGTPDGSIDGTVDLISAGGPGGSAVSLIAVGESFAATQGTGALGNITTNGDVTIAGGEALFVAQGAINDSSQINLQLAQGPVFVATGTGSSTAVQFNPASAATSGDTTRVEDLIGRLTAASIGGNTFNVQAQFVLLINPAQALLGLEAVGFIDVSLFEEELSLFGVIGQGIALALAQCEEVEGCAPNVTEDELDQLISGLEARINELERRLAEDNLSVSERTRIENVLAGYRDELENFQSYKNQLQEYSSGGEEEEFGDEFGGDEEETPEAGPGQEIPAQIDRLNGIANIMRTRISWLEGLKGNAEERARLSEATGIDLTVEKLDAIIEATQKALQSIENEIKLLQEGAQAQADPADQPFFRAHTGEPVALNVQYGPALLALDDGSLATDSRWY